MQNKNLTIDTNKNPTPSLQMSINAYQSASVEFQKEITEKTIHKLRVSIRKLNTALEVYQELNFSDKISRLQKHTKTQFKKLGKVRDLQVTEMSASFPEFKKFIHKIEKRELKSLKNIQKSWGKKTKKFTSLSLEIKKTLPHLWTHQLMSKTHQTHHLLTQSLAAAKVDQIETIHKLRIALKKYRYLLELGLNQFPQFHEELREIKKMQLYLGKVQDLEVLEKSLKYFIKHKKNLPIAIQKIKSIRTLKFKKAKQALSFLHKNPHLPSPPHFS